MMGGSKKPRTANPTHQMSCFLNVFESIHMHLVKWAHRQYLKGGGSLKKFTVSIKFTVNKTDFLYGQFNKFGTTLGFPCNSRHFQVITGVKSTPYV